MSEYKVQDYINKKMNDITKDLPAIKAYNLGLAVGMLEVYKDFKRQTSQENADKAFKNILDGSEEFNIIFRTMVGLYNEDTNSKVESIIKVFEMYKRPNYIMTDEHRDLIEEFLNFLHRAQEN